MSKLIQDMTEEELEEQLITSDYNGKLFKKECLYELLKREVICAAMDSSILKKYTLNP